MGAGLDSQAQEVFVSTLQIRRSQQALAMLALTLGVAASGRGGEHGPSAARELDTYEPAAKVVPLGDKGKEVPQLAMVGSAGGRRSLYLVALTWCFTFFNTARVLAYLPTVMAIVQHRDSTQHSLFTWLTWLGANITMAAWLFEQNGARLNRAIAVNVANACRCLSTAAVIVAFRL